MTFSQLSEIDRSVEEDHICQHGGTDTEVFDFYLVR